MVMAMADGNGNSNSNRRLKNKKTFTVSYVDTKVFTTSDDKNATITITADDAYELYFNGSLLGSDSNWRDVESFRVSIDETFTIAVKAWDNHKVIAGLSVVIDFDDEERPDIYTNNSSGWILTAETPSDGWNQAGYDVTGWKKVANVFDGRWNTEPVTGRQWVWTENYNFSTSVVETPVYFRLDPLTPYIPEIPQPVYYEILVASADTLQGSVSESPLSKSLGDEVSVSATALTGFEFDYWFDADTESILDELATFTFSVEGNRSLIAHFKAVTPVVDDDDEDENNEDENNEDENNEDENNEDENNEDENNEDENNDDENDTPSVPSQPILPTFVPVTTYSLTVSISGSGVVPGFTGTNNFSSGTNVNLAPTPAEGFEFVGWEGDTDTMTNNVIVMNGNKVITAVFAAIADEEVEVEDEAIAEAAPEEEVEAEVVVEEVIVEAVVEVVTESSVDEGEVSILDGATPQATATEETNLPQTGGIPLEGLVLAGTAFIGLGRKLRKR
jgi:hypothetical protein